MCARFQSSHVQTPADRQSRAHPPRPIHARDGSMPQAQLLRRSLSPNRRGRRLVSRAWTARPLDAGVPPAPRRLGYLPCPLRLKPFHQAERAAQPLHSRSRAPRLLPPLRFLRELLSGELSRHRPPPPEAAPGAPSRRHKATRVSSLRTRRFTDLPIFLPTRHRRPRGLHRATPCHPQRTPSTDRGAPPVNVYVDEPPLRKTPRLPLLFPRSLG